jgi:hypothetical protein
MSLALAVSLVVVAVVVIVGAVGYWIDKSAERDERKWEH